MIYILDDDYYDDDDERSYAFDMFQKGRTAGPIYQGPDDLGFFWGL